MRLKIKTLLSKFAYANFGWIFREFKGFALKNPTRGLCPLDPYHFFEKSGQKLLIVIATGCLLSLRILENNPIIQSDKLFFRKKYYSISIKNMTKLCTIKT